MCCDLVRFLYFRLAFYLELKSLLMFRIDCPSAVGKKGWWFFGMRKLIWAGVLRSDASGFHVIYYSVDMTIIGIMGMGKLLIQYIFVVIKRFYVSFFQIGKQCGVYWSNWFRASTNHCVPSDVMFTEVLNSNDYQAPPIYLPLLLSGQGW